MNFAARFFALPLAAAVLLTPLLRAQAPTAAPPIATPPALYLGTAWYPEQWPESRWDADLALMRSRPHPLRPHRRIRLVQTRALRRPLRSRLASTAPSAAAARHHIAVVIGTPTAAPPAWLTTKYPETLRIKEDGRHDQHGNRQQFNWADPKYRELARAMAEQLAKRFGHDPNVIGWQIDNEYANESYGPADQARFDDWLKARYGTLDNLNDKWTTAYWSETYNDWSQIPIETTYGNPGLLLSWKRFVSDTWRSYQKNQLDVIRANSDPRQFITTNMMGFFDGYDHYTVSQDLDLASWDDYVGTGQLNPVYNGAAHDLTRGFLRKNFWVMETQPGFVNWSPDNNSLDKGAVRAMAWHDVGHGADAVSYWQWRSALNGQEEYHGVLVGADGTPVPLYSEVAQLGAEFAKAGPALAGTTVHSDVAILHSYDAFWAINWQRHNKAFDPLAAIVSYYGAIRALTHSVDIVNPSVDLSQYKLVVAPALNVLTDDQARNLIDYVHNGGHLVLTQRSAMKTIDNALQTPAPARPPRSPARRPRRTVLRTRLHHPHLRRLGPRPHQHLGRAPLHLQPRHQSPHALRQDSATAGSTTNPPPSPAKSARAASPTSAPTSKATHSPTPPSGWSPMPTFIPSSAPSLPASTSTSARTPPTKSGSSSTSPSNPRPSPSPPPLKMSSPAATLTPSPSTATT